MLDTDTCIYALKRSAYTMRKMESYEVGDIAISSIVLAELQFGVHKSTHREKNRLRLQHFLQYLQVFQFDESAAESFGKIKAHLAHKGQLIGPMDMLIAAHALSTEVVLVTNNTKEFKRVPGLSVVDWSGKK